MSRAGTEGGRPAPLACQPSHLIRVPTPWLSVFPASHGRPLTTLGRPPTVLFLSCPPHSPVTSPHNGRHPFSWPPAAACSSLAFPTGCLFYLKFEQ